MWEQKSKSNPEEEYTFTAVANPEQEKFYHDVHQVVDRNRVELAGVEVYGKYRFWKAIFGSSIAQVVFALVFIGLCVGVRGMTQNPFVAVIIVLGCAVALVALGLMILWKIFQIITWPIRAARESLDYKARPWYLGYDDGSQSHTTFYVLFFLGVAACSVYGLIWFFHH